MYEIVYAEFLSADIKRFVIRAPKIAKKRKPGQFVIVRVSGVGERIPLTIADSDNAAGTITIIVQRVGRTTGEMMKLRNGDSFHDVVGPLGKPSHIENFGTAVSIGGGVGTAIAFPIAKALKEAGNQTISIIGARNRDLVILEDDMKQICDEVIVTTDDGSYGRHGFVTDALKQLIEERKIDFVLAIGPIPMMKAVANVTRPHGIQTVVSLNPVMVDGTGMCGGCRAVVGEKTVFVCVDGPEFDAHQVDFEILMNRNRFYHQQEKKTAELHHCRIDAAAEALKAAESKTEVIA